MKREPTKIGYSIREACDATSLGRTTIYALIKANKLHTVRCGGRTIVLAESIHELLSVEG